MSCCEVRGVRAVSFDDNTSIHTYTPDEDEVSMKQKGHRSNELYQQETKFYSALVQWKRYHTQVSDINYSDSTFVEDFFRDTSCINRAIEKKFFTLGQLVQQILVFIDSVWSVKEVKNIPAGKTGILYAVIVCNLVSEFLMRIFPYEMRNKDYHLHDVFHITKLVIRG